MYAPYAAKPPQVDRKGSTDLTGSPPLCPHIQDVGVNGTPISRYQINQPKRDHYGSKTEQQ